MSICDNTLIAVMMMNRESDNESYMRIAAKIKVNRKAAKDSGVLEEIASIEKKLKVMDKTREKLEDKLEKLIEKSEGYDNGCGQRLPQSTINAVQKYL